jgi:formate dehydrogenase
MTTDDGSTTVHTHCRICLAGCGVTVSVDGQGKVAKIAPDRENPHTSHDFCAKGRTAGEAISHPRRITTPMRRVGDGYVEATWDEAIQDIAGRLNTIIERDGPDAVGSYWGNPAGGNNWNVPFFNAFLDAIGTRQRYHVGSTDQNNFHLVAEELYGSPWLVLVSDVDDCDFFIVVGSNPAVSASLWIEVVPGGWRRMLERQKQGATIVVVDPIRTESAAAANEHLAVRPGQDWALLLAMLKVILDERLEHAADCAELNGMAEVRQLVQAADLADLAARCDIPVETIQSLARRFATARTAQLVTRTGVAHHTTGTIGDWLGRLLVHVTGRADRPGGHFFNPGYVNIAKLAPRMTVPKTDHISRVAGRPMVAGAHALAELPDEILTPGEGRIRAMVINAGNPVIAGPNGVKLDGALEDLELLIAVDLMQRESHRHADWLIPGTHWLERDDLWTLTNQFHDEPYVQYGRRAVDVPPGVRNEWVFFADLTIAMRRPLFGMRGVNTFIKATRALARILRRPGLAFHPSWLDRLMVRMGNRVTYKDILDHPHGWVFGEREFGHLKKNLLTSDKKVHAAPAPFVRECHRLLGSPQPQTPDGYPYQLSNQRSRHSMNSWLNELPSLHKKDRGNDLQVHPKDAAEIGVVDGDRVRVISRVGSLETTVRISDTPRHGVLVMKHGWGSRVFDPKNGAAPESHGTNRNLLIPDDDLDPLSQNPALSSTFVAVERIESTPR